jgi:adenosylcobinamide-GDP ribazoletransferase
VTLRALRSAVGLLTVVPVAGSDAPPADQLGRALFPLVGAGVGLAAGTAYVVAAAVFTPLVAAVAAVAAGAALTGGLHLDGLADSADGLLGKGGTPARRLEIMRDPRVGSYGAIALALVIAADVALLSAMTPRRALLALLVAGAISRLAVLATVVALPDARRDGLGIAVTGGRRARDLAVGAVITAVVLLIDPRRAVPALVAGAIAALLVAGLARRRIGGATGDVYGACAEICQLAALAVFAAG